MVIEWRLLSSHTTSTSFLIPVTELYLQEFSFIQHSFINLLLHASCFARFWGHSDEQDSPCLQEALKNLQFSQEDKVQANNYKKKQIGVERMLSSSPNVRKPEPWIKGQTGEPFQFLWTSKIFPPKLERQHGDTSF